MTWRTHVLFGISTLWLLAPLPPESLGYDFGTLAACAALGALLPDLDASESKVKYLKLLGTQIQPLMLPAQVVSQTNQHRGLLHSLAGLAMVAGMCLPCLWWVGWSPMMCLLLGYMSHLVADSMTKSGVRWFYPSPHRFYLFPVTLRVTTGSDAEEVFMVCFALTSVALLLARLAP